MMREEVAVEVRSALKKMKEAEERARAEGLATATADLEKHLEAGIMGEASHRNQVRPAFALVSSGAEVQGRGTVVRLATRVGSLGSMRDCIALQRHRRRR